jgi:putative zinc finger/helix-turn-helix YgiT family protein
MTRPFPWKCRKCRELSVRPVTVDYTTEMDHDGRPYTVTVPQLEILECTCCHARSLPDEAFARLAEALRRQVGLLTPEEIRAGREQLGLTQKQLASHLRVAESTVCRWETGAQIQQRVMDLLLRAYFNLPALRQYLKRLQREGEELTQEGKTTTSVPGEAKESGLLTFPTEGQPESPAP